MLEYIKYDKTVSKESPICHDSRILAKNVGGRYSVRLYNGAMINPFVTSIEEYTSELLPIFKPCDEKVYELYKSFVTQTNKTITLTRIERQLYG